MTDIGNALDRGVRRVLLTQVLLTVIMAGGLALMRNAASAGAATYGGAITLVSTWWMARSVHRAGTFAAQDLTRGSLALFAGLAQKYLFAIVALAVGFVLKLDALGLLAGFGLTQAAFLFAGGAQRRDRDTGESRSD